MKLCSRLVFTATLLCASSAFASTITDCSKKSLAQDLAKAGPGSTVVFTGVCTGPILISTDNLTLAGTGSAIIDGGGKDVVTVAGAHGVTLSNLEVRNGANGIVIANGGSATINAVLSDQNSANGIALRTGASAVLGNVSATQNTASGLDLQNGSSVLISGTFSATVNTGSGVSSSASSLTIDSGASLTASTNTGNGVLLQAGSTLVVANQGTLAANSNSNRGLSVDDSVAVVQSATLSGNSRDIAMTFATRGDFTTTTFSTYTCDATVLVRGTSGMSCPH